MQIDLSYFFMSENQVLGNIFYSHSSYLSFTDVLAIFNYEIISLS